MRGDDRCLDCGQRFEQEIDEDGHGGYSRCPDCQDAFDNWADDEAEWSA